VRGWTTLAEFMMKQKKYESGIKFFERASTIDPNCLEAKIGIGKCNYYLKKIDEAIEIFEAVEPKYPNNFDVIYNLGNCFYLKGNFHDVIF
jgi:tetratricopeptide (TPR) repeat protein